MADLPGASPAAPPIPPGPVPPAAGSTAPATVPPDNQGQRARAVIKINLALAQINQAIPLFGGSSTEEGRELMTIAVKLGKKFGPSSQDLNRQEVKMLGQNAGAIGPPAGGGDVAGLIKQRLMGGGQGAPAQTPPVAA